MMADRRAAAAAVVALLSAARIPTSHALVPTGRRALLSSRCPTVGAVPSASRLHAEGASSSKDEEEDASKRLGVPFFASFADPSGGGAGDGGPAQVATVTTRLPLGTLLDSRDYVFTAATNVRGYEWTLRETDELYDDLTSALGGFGSRADDQGGGTTYDYELNQIVLVPLEWDTAALGLGRRYGVYDGQQRLVTLCLLLAALRESFRDDADHEGTVMELTNMLNPPKARKDSVLRIELRKRDDECLRRILVPELTTQETDAPRAGGGGSGSVRVDLPLPGTPQRKRLSATSRRVVENYERLSERVGEMTSDERVRFVDYLVEHVHMLVCVPETARIARNIVMAQGKGMDNEPIDDFKGLVCFRYTRDEDDMYRTFDRWDELAAPPADDAESSDSSTAVGRDVVASACLLRASAALGRKVRKNDEVNALERWLRQDLIENGDEGKDFYEREVEPSARALYLFREGDVEAFRHVVGGSGGTRRRRKKKGGDDDEEERLRQTTEARLRFLRDVTIGAASAREAEAAVLDLLLRAGGVAGRKRPSSKELDAYLGGVELLALWMAVTKPPPSRRHEACLDYLGAVDDKGAKNGDLESVVLSQEERALLRNKLASFEFGATPSGRKVAAAILERLNDYQSVINGEGMPEIKTETWVEHVLPVNPAVKYWDNHWPGEDDREQLLHGLGNLVLMSRRATAREKNGTFAKKKERYEQEAWPLTCSVSTCSNWNKSALLEQQEKLLLLADSAWGLQA